MYRITIEASINAESPREAIWQLQELMDYYTTRHGGDELDSTTGVIDTSCLQDDETIYTIHIIESDEKIKSLTKNDKFAEFTEEEFKGSITYD